MSRAHLTFATTWFALAVAAGATLAYGDERKPPISAKTAAGQASPKALEVLTPDRLGVYTAPSSAHCEFPAAHLSPSGRFLVSSRPVWRRTTAVQNSIPLQFTDLDCLTSHVGSSSPECSIALNALDGLRIVGWSPDDLKAILIEQDAGLAIVDIAEALSGRVSIQRTPLSKSIATVVSSESVFRSTAVDDIANLFKGAYAATSSAMRPGETLLSLSVHEGRPALGVVEKDGSLDAWLLEGTTRRALGAPGAMLMQAHPSWIKGGAAVVNAQGFSLGSGPKGVGSDYPYSSPQIDAKTGELVNFTSPFLKNGKGGVLYGESRRGQDFMRLLKNATGLDLSGTRRNRPWRIDCALGSNDRSHRLEDRYVQLGTPDRPLFGVKATQNTSDHKKLAVFFSGGPVSGITFASDNFFVKRLAALGYDVLAVNYSGSSLVGLNTLTRLEREGPITAIEKDMSTLVYHLDREKPEDLLIVGTSLGSLPALTLDNKLASHLHRTVLIEPLLKRREPETWVSRAAFAPYQRSFEATTLGLNNQNEVDSFADGLDNLQSNRSSSTFFVAFGREDRVSRFADWRQRPGCADAVAEFAGDHTFAAFNPDLWASLEHWIKDPGKVKPCK